MFSVLFSQSQSRLIVKRNNAIKKSFCLFCAAINEDILQMYMAGMWKDPLYSSRHRETYQNNPSQVSQMTLDLLI